MGVPEEGCASKHMLPPEAVLVSVSCPPESDPAILGLLVGGAGVPVLGLRASPQSGDQYGRTMPVSAEV